MAIRLWLAFAVDHVALAAACSKDNQSRLRLAQSQSCASISFIGIETVVFFAWKAWLKDVDSLRGKFDEDVFPKVTGRF